MTPRELIHMLAKWDLDESFEVALQNIPEDLKPMTRDTTLGGLNNVVILTQGGNTINLSGKDR